MKRQKKLLAMLAVLALLTLAILGAKELTAASRTVDTQADDVVIFTAPEEVTSLSWTYGGETQTAVLKDGLWCSGADSSVELDGDAIEDMLGELTEVVADRTIEDPESLADYGLREPQNTICVNYLEDLTLFLGNETGIGGQYYCSIDDGKVYIIDASLAEAFTCALTDITATEETTA